MNKLLKKFTHWMNYNPPGSMTSKGWRLFKREFKEKAPIRFWIKNDFRYKVTLPIRRKCESIRDWLRYRTYDRYHVVDTGLPPAYYDAETQMINASFNILKDFVEVELAWNTYMWSEERKNASFWEKHLPFYRFFKPFRSREFGLKNLNWAATLDDPNLPLHERCDHQAISAREIKELYLWWVDKVPERKEREIPLFNDQGLGILGSLDSDFDANAKDYCEFKKAMEENDKLNKQWKEEDTEMFIRLVKIREHLWL